MKMAAGIASLIPGLASMMEGAKLQHLLLQSI